MRGRTWASYRALYRFGRLSETFTGCGLQNASISSWICSFTDACMVNAIASLQLHPACCQFQPLPSPLVIILTAGDPTYMAVYCCRTCISNGWKLPLEQSATRCHLSSNADCFSELPQNLLSLLPIISFLTVFGLVPYTVFSIGLAVL